jgi:hypothetical protein
MAVSGITPITSPSTQQSTVSSQDNKITLGQAVSLSFPLATATYLSGLLAVRAHNHANAIKQGYSLSDNLLKTSDLLIRRISRDKSLSDDQKLARWNDVTNPPISSRPKTFQDVKREWSRSRDARLIRGIVPKAFKYGSIALTGAAIVGTILPWANHVWGTAPELFNWLTKPNPTTNQ